MSEPHQLTLERGFDVAGFRRGCGQFLTGVTVVTTKAEDGIPLGFTANSFTSVSPEPPLVLVCLDRRSGSYASLLRQQAYAAHVLGKDQVELSRRFATRGAEKFAGLDEDQPNRCPLLPRYLAMFECARVVHYDGGDHGIFVGRSSGSTRAIRSGGRWGCCAAGMPTSRSKYRRSGGRMALRVAAGFWSLGWS